MKNGLMTLSKRTALTLTELLVSSVLMGIVMVGIAGFSVAIKRMQDTTDKQAIIAVQVATAMAYMERAISQTFGSDAIDNGLNGAGCNGSISTYCFDGSNPETSWSFRTDPANTPTNYADDIWLVFYKPNSGVSQNNLYACTQLSGVCPGCGPDPDNGQIPCGINRVPVLYRKLVSLTMTWVNNTNPSTLDQRVDIAITGRFNAAAAYDPIDNPEYSMSTSVSLPSYANNPF
jgi:type II secretory pathway pseudopilin PulG